MRTTLMMAAMAAAFPAANAVAQVPPPIATTPADATLLEVSAIGRTVRTPDIATIRAGVVTQAPTAGAALAENSNRMARVVAALKAAGVATRDVTTSNVGLSPQYRYVENQPPKITGYQATNTVTVKFRDIAKSGAALDALVTAGANQIDGPTMSIDRPEAALDEARTDAVKKARARAELYAQAAGLRVERIASISESGENAEGPRPPMPYMARAVAQDSATVVLPGESEVTATLLVRFVLR
jgi:uncharacterized protein